MALTTSVSTTPDVAAQSAPDTFDVSDLWEHRFPSPEMLAAAAGLLTPLRRWQGNEGARARLVIGPGMVQVATVDPARAERAADRERHRAAARAGLLAADLLLEGRLVQADADLEVTSDLAAGGLVGWAEVERAGAWADHLAGRVERRDAPPAPRRSKVTKWSAKSRANMVRKLSKIDYSPLFDQDGVPAMVTLTYPGDWEAVAPDAATAYGHLRALGKRFQRAYGRPLIGVWKREFQRRGAPHYHLHVVPPRGVILHGGQRVGFGQWLSATWADVVGHPDAEQRRRHVLAGTGIDYAEGMRASDPRRLAVYFAKHGAYAAKEYQNEAPAAWLADGGSVGRFWGVWGLKEAVEVVEVTPVEQAAAARTLRRWQRANGYRAQVEVRRRRWDTETGEPRHRAHCDDQACEGCVWTRRSGVWSGSKMRGLAGFAVCNDGAAMVAQLARHLDAVREEAQEREVREWLDSPVRIERLDLVDRAAARPRVSIFDSGCDSALRRVAWGRWESPGWVDVDD